MINGWFVVICLYIQQQSDISQSTEIEEYSTVDGNGKSRAAGRLTLEEAVRRDIEDSTRPSISTDPSLLWKQTGKSYTDGKYEMF